MGGRFSPPHFYSVAIFFSPTDAKTETKTAPKTETKKCPLLHAKTLPCAKSNSCKQKARRSQVRLHITILSTTPNITNLHELELTIDFLDIVCEVRKRHAANDKTLRNARNAQALSRQIRKLTSATSSHHKAPCARRNPQPRRHTKKQ